MEIRARRFNIYFCLAAVWLAAYAGGGCASPEKKQREQLGSLRVHLEVNTDPSGFNTQVPIYRAQPVMVNVLKEPFLTEADLTGVRVVQDREGLFALELKFTRHGAWVIENYSASNPGKRFAVFAQWGVGGKNSRWLAAPRINYRITDATLVFTPDASREEVDELVLGLNNTAKKLENQPKPKKK